MILNCSSAVCCNACDDGNKWKKWPNRNHVSMDDIDIIYNMRMVYEIMPRGPQCEVII